MRRGQKINRLLSDRKPRTNEQQNHRHFEHGRTLLKIDTEACVPPMDATDEGNDDNGQSGFIDTGPNPMHVGTEGDGGPGDGRGKPHGRAYKTRHKTQGRVINFRQKIVFATVFRQASSEFGITKSTTERQQPTNQPNHHNAKTGLDIEQLVPQTGKNPGTYHVGYHNAGGTK